MFYEGMNKEQTSILLWHRCSDVIQSIKNSISLFSFKGEVYKIYGQLFRSTIVVSSWVQVNFLQSYKLQKSEKWWWKSLIAFYELVAITVQ